MSRRIPEWFIDELIGRADIVGVVEAHVPLRRAGKDFKGLCPFHEERTPSFTVSPDKQFYHCFGCGAHGTAIGFLMQLLNLEFPEAVAELAGRTGMSIPEDEGAGVAETKHREIYASNEAAATFYAQQLRSHPAAPQAIAYLRSRGISGEMAKEFGIGYAPPGWNNLVSALGKDAAKREALLEAGLAIRKGNDMPYDRFRDRIMLPIHDARGRVVGFGGRVLGQDEPKYLNSPETPIFHKGQELYNLNRARMATREAKRILVVEGYLDVIALVQHGVRNVVATLGTATTRNHLDRLFRSCGEVTFCFDGDNAGQRAAWRALVTSLPLLQAGRYVSFLFLPPGDDPDTLVRRQGAAWFENEASYRSLAEVLLEHVGREADIATIDGRARFVDLARPLIEQLPHGAYRRLIEQRLSELVCLPEAEVGPLLASNRPPVKRSSGGASPARAQPSLVRTAISLLLQRPDLAPDLGDTAWLRQISQPGATVLADLLALLEQQPHLLAPALIERFRDQPIYEHLKQLWVRDLPTPAAGVADELRAAIARLRQTALRSGGTIGKNDRPSAMSDREKEAYRKQIEDLANRG